MAVVEMSKMRIVGIDLEENSIIDVLHKTGAVQIKIPEEFDETKIETNQEKIDLLNNKMSRIELSLNILAESISKIQFQKNLIKDGFEVNYSEFEEILGHEKEIEDVSTKILSINEEIYSIKGKISELNVIKNKYLPYENINSKFSIFKSTKFTNVFFGQVPTLKLDKLIDVIKVLEFTSFEKLGAYNSNTIVSIISYGNDISKVQEVLFENGFMKCEFNENSTAKEIINSINGRIELLKNQEYKELEKIALFVNDARNIKILLDRYKYELEKLSNEKDFRRTDRTFLLEGYVPTKSIEDVKIALNDFTNKIYIEFVPVTDNDCPPSLMCNKNTVKQFEFVTNMYSVPKYNTLDPNTVMSFFFSLFMGLIVADFAYGIIMFIGCKIFVAKKKSGGVCSLANVLALGGLFALPFGIIFDSFLGYPLIHKIMEINLGTNNNYEVFYSEHLDAIKSFSSVAGISVPTILLWSLCFGILHLAVGLIMKAIQEFKRKNIFGGIVDGLMWAIFLIGLATWSASMVDTIKSSSLSSPLSNIGLGMIIIGFSIGVLFAGKGEKGFKKATKSFVAVYGVLNYFSDILSYARLYGLMLSGSQIAAIFTNTIAINMLMKNMSIIGIIAGIIVIILGNIFNLAMGVLGAYIHDSRLQYVEFFGKFYEGDGELFTPIGSSFNYITLIK